VFTVREQGYSPFTCLIYFRVYVSFVCLPSLHYFPHGFPYVVASRIFHSGILSTPAVVTFGATSYDIYMSRTANEETPKPTTNFGFQKFISSILSGSEQNLGDDARNLADACRLEWTLVVSTASSYRMS